MSNPVAINISFDDFGTICVIGQAGMDIVQAKELATRVVAELKAGGDMDDFDAVLSAFARAGFAIPMFEQLDADAVPPALTLVGAGDPGAHPRPRE